MAFFTLPLNLRLEIVNLLDPASIFHFALTCRSHFELCQNIVQESACLASQWSVVNITCTGSALRRLLTEVLQDPRKGWHVEELRICGYSEEDGSDSVSEEDSDLLRAAAMDLVSLYCYEPKFFFIDNPDERINLEETLVDRVVRGSNDAMVAILLHHLPRIETLRFDADAEEYTCLDQVMRLIADGYQDTTIAPQLPLQHLKTTAISYSDTEGCHEIDWACYFLCIPSLRTFAAWAMGSEDVTTKCEDHLRTVSAPVSNVEELFFQRCQFDTRSMDTILPLVKNLKRFTYESGGATVAYSYYEPRKVIRALAQYAGNSLEELVLVGQEADYTVRHSRQYELVGVLTASYQEDEDDISIVSLRNFRKLRSITCELRCLMPSPDADSDVDEALSDGFLIQDSEGCLVSDPRNRLPDDLQELYLHGVFEHDEWEQLHRTFENSNAATPKLLLDNICIRNLWKPGYENGVPARIGAAEEPPDIFSRSLAKLLGP